MSKPLPSRALRWGHTTRAESLGAHQRLLDAALRCYQRLGIAKTTVADIAEEAGITRRTVYRYFDGHRAILYAVIDREMLKFWDVMLRDLAPIVDFSEFLVESFFYTRRYAEQADTTQVLFGQDILPIVNEVYLARAELLQTVAQWLQPYYRRSVEQGYSRDGVDLQQVSEWFTRVLISYLAIPSPLYRNDDELRALFAVMLKPVFDPRLKPG